MSERAALAYQVISWRVSERPMGRDGVARLSRLLRVASWVARLGGTASLLSLPRPSIYIPVCRPQNLIIVVVPKWCNCASPSVFLKEFKGRPVTFLSIFIVNSDKVI